MFFRQLFYLGMELGPGGEVRRILLGLRKAPNPASRRPCIGGLPADVTGRPRTSVVRSSAWPYRELAADMQGRQTKEIDYLRRLYIEQRLI